MENSDSIIIYEVGMHLMQGEIVCMSKDHFQSMPFAAICQHNGIQFVEFGWVQESICERRFAFSGELILQKQMTVIRLEISCIDILRNCCKFHQYLLQGEWVNDYIIFNLDPVSQDFGSFIISH